MNGISAKKYTKEQVCRYLVKYHHLTAETALSGPEDIAGYVRKVGCIQYDPLDVVGRNPDLVLQSRCKAYKKDDIQTLLYTDRLLFDVWDKNMSIAAATDWPYYDRFRKRHLPWCEEHREAIDAITNYLAENECACSSDFALEERVDWHYGPQRLAKAALECMCYAGLAVVHHKKGARRYYGPAYKFIPQEHFNRKDPDKTDEEHFKRFVLRRINSVGALQNRAGDAWLGEYGFKSARREEAFKALLSEGRITEIEVEGLKYPLYLAAENMSLLEEYAEKPCKKEYVRIIAPLDNMLWDRRLVSELFGFDYKWEVYVPAPQRKYGYYALPMLLGEKFIGRIEMSVDKAVKKLTVKNIWYEKDENPQKLERYIKDGLSRFAQFNRCNGVGWGN